MRKCISCSIFHLSFIICFQPGDMKELGICIQGWLPYWAFQFGVTGCIGRYFCCLPHLKCLQPRSTWVIRSFDHGSWIKPGQGILRECLQLELLENGDLAHILLSSESMPYLMWFWWLAWLLLMLPASVALDKGSKDIQKFKFVFYIQMLVP